MLLLWEKIAQWHMHCFGAAIMEELVEMYWGIIGSGWKCPFWDCDPVMEQEIEHNQEYIVCLNTEMDEAVAKANNIWG